MIKHKSFSVLFWALLILLPGSPAATGLQRLVSDGAVLQRNVEIPIRGRAAPEEKIAVEFQSRTWDTRADETGKWRIDLPPMPAGGPYTLTVKADTTVTVNNVLIGDVWLASGQSNMELPMERVKPLYEQAIATATNSQIRYFDVPDRFNFKQPERDLDGGRWRTTTPENVLEFSAVAYFFARALNRQYDIPVGIINASVGGSPVQAWLSEEALKAFPEYHAQAKRFRNEALIERIRERDKKRIDEWRRTLDKKDPGKKGDEYPWAENDIDTDDWNTLSIPGYWPPRDDNPVNGVFWFRKTMELPRELAEEPARLNLGRIVDADTTFVNGTEVGSTGYQYPPRRYRIPEGILKAGTNTIAVRVISERGRGGFIPDKDYELLVDDQRFDLTGDWRYRMAAEMPALQSQTFIRWKPLGLYNAMIAPLTQYPITGVIWYQGESNVSRPDEYYALFSRLIADWRNQWDRDAFPFLYVQLANFKEPNPAVSPNNWARLREAQLNTLSVPDTAMAVTIDIGEWNDIHPLNKKDVGERLAAAARTLAYGDDAVYSGPIYNDMKREDNKIVLSFKHVNGGLKAAEGEALRGFEIAGTDRRFVSAKAEIRGNKVMVWSEAVNNPVAVRYAWTDNPVTANLYNAAGFPASPFRTDEW